MAAHLKVDAAEFRAWNASAKTCSPNGAPAAPRPRLSFAFQGSGLLLPFYQGVVQALQDRGVLSAAVSKSAAFGGGSGGSLTSVLTALGWPGRKQYATFVEILAGIEACKAAAALGGASAQERDLQCTLNSVGLPIVTRKIKEANPNAAAEISNRVTICAFFFVWFGKERERWGRKKGRKKAKQKKRGKKSLPSFSLSFSRSPFETKKNEKKTPVQQGLAR